MRKINHWTPRYIGNRLALAIYEQQHRDYPWLTRTAISILSSYLKPSDVGLEWGCGRSTAWFAARMKHLVSVEDNPQWYEIVKNKLANLNLANTELVLAPNRDAYIGVVNKFPDRSLDFVLVDGKSYRSTCAVNAVNKIKLGGLIVVDNANWFLPSNSYSPNSQTYDSGPASEEWQQFLTLTKDWRTIWTSNGVTDTAFFIKTEEKPS